MTEIEELARKWFDEDEREAEDLIGMTCPAREWANVPEELRGRYLSRARDAFAKAMRYAAGAFIDWGVIHGHEPSTPEIEESHRNATWLDQEADRIEAQQ